MICQRQPFCRLCSVRSLENPDLHCWPTMPWTDTAPWIVNSPMNSRIFETRIETQLAPTLSPADIVILDNVGFHKSERAELLVKAKGAWLLFLPPHLPDLNPIEMAFSKLKAVLRKRAARSFDTITQAIGDIIAYSPSTNAETCSKLRVMRSNRCDTL